MSDEIYLWNLWARGASCLSKGAYEEALKCFDVCLKKDGDDTFARQNKEKTLVKMGRYADAAQCFADWEPDILSAFISLTSHDIDTEIEEKRQLAPFLGIMLKNDEYFTSIKKNIRGDIDTYQKIYIKSLLIISLLYIDFRSEDMVAHYTTETTAQALVKDSPMRLSLITASNDEKEGQSLLDYFSNGIAPPEEQTKIIETQFGAFATSFTFNPDHHFQFCRYGKSSGGIKKGGVSLVVKSSYFNTINPDNSNFYTSILDRRKKESGLFLDKPYQNKVDDAPKLPLFRCIYINPQEGLVSSLGQKEESSFYKNEKTKFDDYQHRINRILEEVRYQLEAIKKDIINMDFKIISQLLLALRYLTKDKDFQQEQECRIIEVKSLSKANYCEKAHKKYFDYLSIREYLEKIILGSKFCKNPPKAKNGFGKAVKNAGIENIDLSRCWSIERMIMSCTLPMCTPSRAFILF
jgi:tetratricopeptide (TPR) repeat protein